MKKNTTIKYAVMFVIALLYGNFRAQAQGPGLVPGELFFKLTDTSAILPEYTTGYVGSYPYLQDVIDSFEVTSISRPFTGLNHTKSDRIYSLKFSVTDHLPNLLPLLQSKSIVEYAEWKHIIRFLATPPDFDSSKNWNLARVWGPKVWDYMTANPPAKQVTIMVIDDAFNTFHQDLKAGIWTNPNDPVNGIDDDGNGYIDDYMGWDFGNNDNNVNPAAGMSTDNKLYHGTHVAGIAAAPDNGVGINSLAPGFIKIIPVKLTSDITGDVPADAPWKAIEYAIKMKPDVVSMSWGMKDTNNFACKTLRTLIRLSSDSIIWVAAAGNDGVNMDIPGNSKFYPGADHEVIGVGSTDKWDRKSIFSNYGDSVDIMAPGTGIYSAIAKNNSSYAWHSGTSMATPLVSSIAALMKAYKPHYTRDSIQFCLELSADHIGMENYTNVNKMGAGRVNAWRALQCNAASHHADFHFLDSTNEHLRCLSDSVGFKPYNYNLGGAANVNYNWDLGDGFTITTTDSFFKHKYSTSGKYHIKLTITDVNFPFDTLAQISKPDYVFISPCDTQAVRNEHTHWLFGQNVHIDYSSGRPVFNPDVATTANDSINIFEEESSFSISDSAGNLTLFGRSLQGDIISKFNDTFRIKNGDYLNPGGTPSQGFLPIYLRGKYYVFAVMPNEENYPFHYYEYDPVKDSLSPAKFADGNNNINTSEVITCVRKCDGDSLATNDNLWIITHGHEDAADHIKGALLIYSFDYDTLTKKYILSAYDTIQTAHQNTLAQGIIKVSPDGRYLAINNDQQYFHSGADSSFIYFTEIYSFNRTTAQITHLGDVPYGGTGITFSPKSGFLYIVNNNMQGGPNVTELINSIAQVNLNQSDVTKNVKMVGADDFVIGMNIGPDNKLYYLMNYSGLLGVIAEPDKAITSVKGADEIGMYPYAVGIPDIAKAESGLPNFNDGTPAYSKEIQYARNSCRNYTFRFGTSCDTFAYSWRFKEYPLDSAFSTSATPTFSFGSDTLRVRLIRKKISDGTPVDTFNTIVVVKDPIAPALKKITGRDVLCAEEDFILKDTTGDEENEYQWWCGTSLLDEQAFTLISRIPKGTPAGTVRIKSIAKDAYGCQSDTGIYDLLYSKPDTQFVSPTNFVFCHFSDSIIIKARNSGPSLIYTWQMDTGTGYFTIPGAGHSFTYHAKDSAFHRFIVENGYGCMDTSYGKLVTPQGRLNLRSDRGYFLPLISDTLRLATGPATANYTSFVWIADGDTLFPQSGVMAKSAARQSAVYQILAKGPCGVDTSNRVAIKPLCQTGIYNDQHSNGGYIAPLTYTSGSGYYIGNNQTLRIMANTTTTFQNTSLIMGACSEIIIEPGARLNILLTSISSCTTWKGITIEGDTSTAQLPTQLNMVSSGIRDANVAIHSENGGTYTVDNCVFRNNYVHVAVIGNDTSKRRMRHIEDSRFKDRLYGPLPCSDTRWFTDTIRIVQASGDTAKWLPQVYLENLKGGSLYRNSFKPGMAVFGTTNETTREHKVGLLLDRTVNFEAFYDTFTNEAKYGIATYNAEGDSSYIVGCRFIGVNDPFPKPNLKNGVYAENSGGLKINTCAFKFLERGAEIYNTTTDTVVASSNLFKYCDYAITIAPTQWPYSPQFIDTGSAPYTGIVIVGCMDTVPCINQSNDTQKVRMECNGFENNIIGITVSGRILKQGDSTTILGVKYVRGAENHFTNNSEWNIYHDNRMDTLEWYYYYDTMQSNPQYHLTYNKNHLRYFNGVFTDTIYRADTISSLDHAFCFPYPAAMAEPGNLSSTSNAKTNGYQVYPNPTEGMLNIQYTGEDNIPYTIELFDILGKKLISTKAVGAKALDISGYAAGTYLVKITDEMNPVQVFKIIKE